MSHVNYASRINDVEEHMSEGGKTRLMREDGVCVQVPPKKAKERKRKNSFSLQETREPRES